MTMRSPAAMAGLQQREREPENPCRCMMHGSPPVPSGMAYRWSRTMLRISRTFQLWILLQNICKVAVNSRKALERRVKLCVCADCTDVGGDITKHTI